MPRRNQPRRSATAEHRPLGGALANQRLESGSDGEWYVRSVTSGQAAKVYRCPGCDHEIREGVPHLVTWPAQEFGSVADRRHWHSGCWTARGRRGPTNRRW